MAPNDPYRQIGYPASSQEFTHPTFGSSLTGAESMARSDSGYQSNLSNPRTRQEAYCGDLNPGIQEELEDDCGYASLPTSMAEYHQHDTFGLTNGYWAEQQSDLAGAGSHVLDSYLDDSRPRTADPMGGIVYGASNAMDLDDNADYHFKEEETRSYWANDFTNLSQYVLEPCQGYAQSTSMSPSTSFQGTTAGSYLDTTLPPPAAPSTTTTQTKITTCRRRLPTSKPSTTTVTSPTNQHHNLTLPPAPFTSTGPSKYPCLVENCTKQFNRAADLDRHIKFLHNKNSVKSMLCDYRRCPRHTNPFHRADHFRDHLRDQHREDLLKRGGDARGGEQDLSWWRSRAPGALYGGWWRCKTCFAKVVVEDDQWQCRKCGNYCETERQAVRKLPLECSRRECLEAGEKKKFWSPGRYREHLREEHGEDVPRNEGRDGAAELASEEWWGSRSAEALCSSVWRCTRCLDAVESRRDGFECPRCGFGCEEVRRSVHVGAVEWMDGDGGQ